MLYNFSPLSSPKTILRFKQFFSLLQFIKENIKIDERRLSPKRKVIKKTKTIFNSICHFSQKFDFYANQTNSFRSQNIQRF